MTDRLEAIRIRNFQSIADVSLDLGALTVIVGKSNSGKSAVIRALKAVARNGTFPSAVRAGSTRFDVTLSVGDTDVSIERGKSLSTYRLTDHAQGTEEVYTKSGRDVPEDIAEALALPRGAREDLTFAGQLDTPFMLSMSPSEAAKTLGDLSNVSRLYEAAREANRLRVEAERLFKVRRGDIERIAAEVKERFSDLPRTSATLKEARALFESVKGKAARADSLETLIDSARELEESLEAYEQRVRDLPTVEDLSEQIERVSALHRKVEAVRRLGSQVEAAEQDQFEAERAAAQMEAAEVTLAQKYDEILREAGTCPTCSQSTVLVGTPTSGESS